VVYGLPGSSSRSPVERFAHERLSSRHELHEPVRTIHRTLERLEGAARSGDLSFIRHGTADQGVKLSHSLPGRFRGEEPLERLAKVFAIPRRVDVVVEQDSNERPAASDACVQDVVT